MKLRDTYRLVMIARILGVQRWPGKARHALRHNRMPLFWLVTAGTFLLLWGQGHLGAFWDGQSRGETEQCRVLRVVDGDSVRLDCGPGRENLNVRLYCIDAPETDQEPWGRIATEHLRGLVGPTITLETIELDRYRRTIGRLRQDGVDINLRLVFDGVAAVYPQYCVDSEYYEAEARARRNDRGIWAEPGPHQRPWEWRRR